MAYVKFRSTSMKCIVDELFFAKYSRFDSNNETMIKALLEYFEIHDIPLRNITAAACDGAPAMNARYRGFSVFLKEIVPEVITVHCMTHRQHLVSKNLSPPRLPTSVHSKKSIKLSPTRFVLGNLQD